MLLTLQNKAKKLPDKSGVYLFKKGKKILYIGKATSLRDRVRSYFSSDIEFVRSPLIAKMITEADKLDFQTTDSVLEALILEANLIKEFQPAYNTLEKDDKSWNYVVITDENYPRVLLVRGRELLKASEYRTATTFGPFTQGASLKEAMKIVRKIFPYRDKCIPYEELPENKKVSARPCFNAQIGLCPGVCTGAVSKGEYSETIKHIKDFFSGKKKMLLRDLQVEMRKYAKAQEFEKADKAKRTIFALEHIRDVALLKKDLPVTGGHMPSVRIEAYDVAHLSGTNVVGVMTVVEDGEPKKSDYRKFRIRVNPGINDTAALREILWRRFRHGEWPKPDIVVLDGGAAQKNAGQDAVDKKFDGVPSRPKVVAVVKNEKHRPREILANRELAESESRAIILANSEAHRFAIAYHRKLRRKL